MEMSFDPLKKRLATGKVGTPVGKLVRKSTQIGLSPREDFHVQHLKINVDVSNSCNCTAVLFVIPIPCLPEKLGFVSTNGD
jgi:hypothetical protein